MMMKNKQTYPEYVLETLENSLHVKSTEFPTLNLMNSLGFMLCKGGELTLEEVKIYRIDSYYALEGLLVSYLWDEELDPTVKEIFDLLKDFSPKNN